ncbi:MAG: N-acetylglucosamine-6-phosphate deacetylase, partial [Bacilli bacterium]
MEIKGFKNTYVYFEGDGIIKSGFKVENKKIAPIDSDADGLLELDDKYIVIPGFIDKHIHGANHSDAMYPTYDDISNIAKSIAQEGVTGFLPTTMTQSKENVAAALKNIRIYIEQDNDEGAAVLGIHLEGPFISKKYKGSQHEQYILADDIETMKYFQEVSGNNIRHVTFAYEENGREFTEYLVKQGIVASIGHSDA